MKITGLKVKNWHQFQDLELDLTYPKDHKDAGKPLKKVCFIGPNGVGKTKLLKLIATLGNHNYFKISPVENLSIEVYYKLDSVENIFSKNELGFDLVNIQDKQLYTKIETYGKDQFTYPGYQYGHDNASYIFLSGKRMVNDTESNPPSSKEEQVDLSKLKSKIIFSDKLSDFKSKIENLNTTVEIDFPMYLIETSKLELDTKIGRLDYGAIVDRKIANIRIEEALEETTGQFVKIKNIFKETVDGIFLDRLDSKTKELVFKTKRGEEISKFDLSSGIEQIFFRLLFVASFNLSESIILVDEPEISLFPDKQKQIVNWYTEYCDLSGTNQFFFATHSPIVAAQFEACEVVKLDFDENGFVKRVPVETDPRLLDIEGVADELYGIDMNKPLTSLGEEKQARLKFLTRNLKSAKDLGDQTKINELFPEYQKLIKELNAYYFYPEFTLLGYAENKKND